MNRLKLEQIQSLNEDEMDMLYFIVNAINPKIVQYELTPSLFPFIKYDKLKNRVLQCEQFIKDEFKPIYDELKNKLGMV